MISAILALDINDMIGKNGLLPWPRIREDMKWFKSKTEHNVVVMGRTTWESLGKYAPLENRINVVVSSKSIEGADKVISENMLEEIQSLEIEYPNKEIFIIGGAMLYDSTESILDRVYLTKILDEFGGDVAVNSRNLLKNTELESSEFSFASGHDFNLEFSIYNKIHEE